MRRIAHRCIRGNIRSRRLVRPVDPMIRPSELLNAPATVSKGVKIRRLRVGVSAEVRFRAAPAGRRGMRRRGVRRDLNLLAAVGTRGVPVARFIPGGVAASSFRRLPFSSGARSHSKSMTLCMSACPVLSPVRITPRRSKARPDPIKVRRSDFLAARVPYSRATSCLHTRRETDRAPAAP